MKPAFVVLAAWAFSEGAKRRDMPGALLALLLLPVTIAPLILQPDFGQTMLITIVWCGVVISLSAGRPPNSARSTPSAFAAIVR